MLPRDVRLSSAAEFAAVVKGGRRAATRRLVVHALATGEGVPAKAGFVVSGKVGNSVVRHQVTRRLRPLVVAHLKKLERGTVLVVRALPPAAQASSAELAGDLHAGVASALRKAGTAGPRSARGLNGGRG